MEYNFRVIEDKWRRRWEEDNTFKAADTSDKPKFYVLDMFPYPSGAGLHVGHPLGYIASDIISRYKRLQGFNVLHPMGFDAFGLPAEQYAISTGKHPAVTTRENSERYISQLKNIGFSFDWDRMISTSDPEYYRWTQWIFLKLFGSWYDTELQQARPIDELEVLFENDGSEGIAAFHDEHETFSGEDWQQMHETQRSEILMKYRLAYQSHAYVNWCEALGTVLANDEVKDGLSERGGHPVERRRMRQWFLRITAYAERLLNDLNELDWTDSLKEMQRNWIGKSTGASVHFALENGETLEVFTTRPDTIFGVTFMVLAPESEWVQKLTSDAQKEEVEKYVNWAKNRSERERQTEVKTVTGAFTGSYAIHPFTGNKIPVWTGDYVLAGYGTGAVMAVPAHDARDFRFAKHFGLEIPRVIAGADGDTSPLTDEAYEAKDGKVINSGFLDGLDVKDAITRAVEEIEAKGLGARRENFRLRDANFSRQRYWGEPFPIYYRNGVPTAVPEESLPLQLPEMDDFKPTGRPESPLAKLTDWTYDGYPLETDTMPGFAGSSWYFLRYMDPHNPNRFADNEALKYWKDVDLYVGGTEHAVGHLLYSRFWHKVLFDYGLVPTNEPFRKLVNQGMIQGTTRKIARLIFTTADSSKSLIKPDKIYTGYGTDFVKFEDIFRNHKSDSYVLYVSEDFREKYLLNTTELYLKNENIIIGFQQPLIPIEAVDYNTVDDKHYLNVEAYNKWEMISSEGKSAIYLTNLGFFDSDIKLIQHTGLPPFNQETGEPYSDGELFKFTLHAEIDKMSKTKYNVINPDDIISSYGADTLRLYEMFLGPLEQSKPWNTNGIEGTHRFLRKLWNLYHNGDTFQVTEEEATAAERKTLHTLIKKIGEDVERFSFNTCVSSFMICVNELGEQKCSKREILEPLAILLSPFAPHLAEEIWQKLGHENSISYAPLPAFNPAYLVESSFNYPVSFNGKTRYQAELPADMSAAEVEAAILADERTERWKEGKEVRKVIVVPKRIVNIVLG